MSTHIDFLAKQDSTHNITVCANNLIHFNFKQGILHLHPQEFIDLSIFLRLAERQIRKQNAFGDSNYFLLACPNQTYVAWLQGLGLHLTQTDFLALVTLANSAVTKLKDENITLLNSHTSVPSTCSVSQTVIGQQTFIYLNWVQITIQVPLFQFLKLSPFLSQAQIRLQKDLTFCDGFHTIERDYQNCYQVWLGSKGFYFSENKFNQFVELVRKADDQMRFQNQINKLNLFNDHQYTFSDN